MNTDLQKLFKKYILCSFCEQMNIQESKEIKQNDHLYFRFLCFSFIEFMRNVHLPNIKLGSRYEAVFIEFRVLPHLEFLIRNAIFKLGSDWSHTIVCGSQNYDFFSSLCQTISPNIKIINTEIENLTADSYNLLLTSTEFWDLFQGDKVLIYQEDSIIFNSNINDFLSYDYVGAPFPKSQNDTPNCVGNGGFSLRTKSCMYQVISKISLQDTNFNSSTKQYMKNSKLKNPPEDVYFSKNMQDFSIGLVAPYEIAQTFSTESVYFKNPVGGHKFWISNPKWKQKMLDCFTFSIYQPNSDLIEYLQYYNIPKMHSRLNVIPNAFDIDFEFCDIVNNLRIGKKEEISKYIKLIGLNGFIYHPKQILNLFPDCLFYKFMKDIYIVHKFNVYKSSDFVNKYIYQASFEDFEKNLIKMKFNSMNKSIDVLLVVFIGNEEKGIDLIKRIILYKNTEKFNIAFCLNINQKFSDNFKSFIKANFACYAIYGCKEMGTDITPTLLMVNDILKNFEIKHIIKLHTKSISNQYLDLTNYILSKPVSHFQKELKSNCNCVGHPDYYIQLKSDSFNSELLQKYKSNIFLNNCFVGGTIFYSPVNVFVDVINFVKKNNFRSFILNNLYENNCINKDNSPIHFLERLFGVIKLNV
jgi:hypothetical protein